MATKPSRTKKPRRQGTSRARGKPATGRERSVSGPPSTRSRLPAQSITALGIRVRTRRQEQKKTQEELAQELGVSRTPIALLEQGRRMPGRDLLEKLAKALGLPENEISQFASPEEQLRLQFEQALSELVGKPLRLESLDEEAAAVARRAIAHLFRSDKTLVQAYDAFCTVLVFYDVPRPSRSFFDHYLTVDATSSPKKFEERVEVFQRDAIRLFATFAEAYATLSRAPDLPASLAALKPRDDEHYRAREAWEVLEGIPPERLPDLGYISAARIPKEQEQRQALATFLTDLAKRLSKGNLAASEALASYPERKRRKMGSLLREFGSTMPHDFLSPLFAPDPDALRRESVRVAPKKENELARIAETQAMGQRNLGRYLAADHLDVYVATSMRTDADFASVNTFVEALFSHDSVRPLKLRYFNPTQSWIEDRVAKGLVEALMLRRADFTIYMAQKQDTFGKDSEASVALGQGKPVIVYVPRLVVPEVGLDTSDVGTLPKDELLRRLRSAVGTDDVDDTADAQALTSQYIQARLRRASDAAIIGAVRSHWADFDLVGEANRAEESMRKAYRKWLDGVVSGKTPALTKQLRLTVEGILTALATNFEKRAHVFREIHPLALQVILSSGVLNGILVARSVESCANLLARLVRNSLDLRLESDENNYRLIERSTGSTIRVISRNQLVANAFSAHYSGSTSL